MAFGFVQNTGSTTQGTSSTTMVIPVTNAPSAGNLLVVAMTDATASDTLSGVTDTQGNTWVIASNFFTAASPALSCAVAYTLQDVGTLTTSDTITTTISAVSANHSGTVDEFTVPAGVLSVDISPVNGSTGVTASSAGSTSVSVGASQATTDAVELVLCVASTRGNAAQTFTQGTGWTKTSSIVKASGQFPGVASEYQITSSAGAQTGTWTLGVSTGWNAVLVSFKVAANTSVSPPAAIASSSSLVSVPDLGVSSVAATAAASSPIAGVGLSVVSPAATAAASSMVGVVTVVGSNWIIAGISMPP